MQVKSLLLTGGALLAASSGAFASGFQVGLTGAKNVGMGGTGTGLYLDQASQFFNPGAFAFAPTGFQIGGNMAIPRISFRPGDADQGQRTLQNTNVFPFSGFIGFGPKEGKWRVGAGVYTPFGSELHYAQGWEGRYSLTDINLRSVMAQATVAYAITPQFSIGGGVTTLVLGDVDLQRDIPVQAQGSTAPAHAQLTGKAEHKVGYNLGVMFKPSDKLSVGISYRSAVNAHVTDGDVKVTGLPASAAGSFTATKFDVTLPLPDVYSFGVGVRPTDKLLLAFDANLVGWSRYQSLDFRYLNGVLGGNALSSSKRQYQDALAFRIGGQYKVTDNFTVRAGTFYDFSAVRDGFVTPETPDADRIGVTAGLGYTFGERFGIDASFLFEDFMKRSQSQDDLISNGTADRVAGTYKTTIYVPGVQLYVKF
ncbi:outer membrane protein transport protein [Hymenobacter sp. H14-R3]|uniref:OmpP1/FadL family transporter n=1 Tax=Hymenobacter sp. H14-R3 TaxID=3046308 RepID=UPI0024BBB5BF|nr:outer membrane protein transport protein [Hymenobacter sp. H14-R3]MDJ0366095.1 outer membrane protein transport protein [Hymenobacter sp. H14-R3]